MSNVDSTYNFPPRKNNKKAELESSVGDLVIQDSIITNKKNKNKKNKKPKDEKDVPEVTIGVTRRKSSISLLAE